MLGAVATAVLLTVGLIGAPAAPALATTAPAGSEYQQCSTSTLSTSVVNDDEAAGAGQRLALVTFKNVGTGVCRLTGAPGISLVGHGDGTQLGQPAEREQAGAPLIVVLGPGDSARAGLQYTFVDQGGGPFDTACAAERADGYRVYPPHSTRSVFVAAPQWACGSDVRWGLVSYVDAASTAIGARGKGCTNAAKVPVGSTVSPIHDVDRDGRTDTQFSGVSGGRLVYGIRTAAGGVVMIADPLKGTAGHSGWTAGLDSAGATITVIDDRRTAKLYAFRGCSFIPVRHQGGGAYEFAIGGTSKTGTGVACNDRNGGTLLQRAALRKRSNGRYDVIWTMVVVSPSGRTAVQDSSTREVRWANLTASDPRVVKARGSFCNDQVKVEPNED